MTSGYNNFKTSTLSRHASSNDHRLELIAPKENANMEAAAKKLLSNEEKAMTVCSKVVYWLA